MATGNVWIGVAAAVGAGALVGLLHATFGVVLRGDQILRALQDWLAAECAAHPVLLILDDFCLDAMDAQESRDAYEILTERHRSGSVIVTSNRTPDEWLAAFADPLRAQSAIDRFSNHAYDLVIEGESYRSRLKPSFSARDAARSLHA